MLYFENTIKTYKNAKNITYLCGRAIIIKMSINKLSIYVSDVLIYLMTMKSKLFLVIIYHNIDHWGWVYVAHLSHNLDSGVEVAVACNSCKVYSSLNELSRDDRNRFYIHERNSIIDIIK